MRVKFSILAILAVALLVGCKGDESIAISDSYSMGTLSLSVTTESSMVVSTKATEEITNEVLEESTDSEGNVVYLLPSRLDIDTQSVMIDIEGSYIIPDSETGTQLESGDVANLEFESMTMQEYESELQYFFAATGYKVSMSYGDPSEEKLDNPCYSGEATFDIVARKEIEQSVVLELCNSIINKVTTTEKFNNYYKLDECQFFITTSAGTTREFKVSSGESAAEPVSESVLFFVEAGTTLTLSGTAVKSNDVEVSFEGDLKSVTEAGKCYTITIDAEDIGSGVIDVEFNDDISSFDVVELEDIDIRPSITE